MVEPRERTRVPLCRWNFNKNEFESVGNLVGFESEEELALSQFFMTLSIQEKYEIFEKVRNAPARGEIPSMTLKEEIKKKYNERRNKTMPFYNDYYSYCLAALTKKGLVDGNPAIHGVQFEPNGAIYLKIMGECCEIYPNDETEAREVELVRDLDPQEFKKTLEEKTGKKLSGGKFNRLCKALSHWRKSLTPFSAKQFNGPVFDKIVFSGNATILIDTYGKKDKTVVKCQNGEPYDPEKALLTALFIREYGKNTYHDLMDICHEEYKKCGEPGVPHDPSVWLRSHSLSSMTKSAADTLRAFADFAKKTD